MQLKNFLLIIMAFSFFGCNSKNENPKNTETPETKDTSAIAAKNINPDAVPDISPMDMIYFPVDYPKLKMTRSISLPPVMRIIYSRPHLQGRKLFYNLQKLGDYWRLGANEATEIEFFKNVTIQNKKIKQGRYVIYCIPQQDQWTLFLNSNIDSWGLTQDSTKNLQQFIIPVTYKNPFAEYFTMNFEKTNSGATLVMSWEDVVAKLPIDF